MASQTITGGMQSWLDAFLADTGAVAGTVHRREGDGLRLVAAVNIPDQVQRVVAWVPNGKGMAGLALQRGEPVHTCNLKDDASGQVRPGAKAVEAQAAVALPVRDRDGLIVAVVGIAFREQRELAPSELTALVARASTLVSGAEAG